MKIGKTSTALIAPLNWGLGHATRMVPVIDGLLQRGWNIKLASSGAAGALLQERYPSLPYFPLTDYNVTYPNGKKMGLAMLRSWPFIKKAIKKEHEEVAAIVAHENIDLIISDNRYGCHHAECRSIIVTHQVKPLAPKGTGIFQPLVHQKLRQYLESFDECWIPDTPDQLLSGQLSDSNHLKIPSKYIGWLSRFSKKIKPEKPAYDWLAILSGPEPQRSILQEQFIRQCKHHNYKAAILAGQPGQDSSQEEGITIFPHLPDSSFLKLVCQSKYVLMRAGYSSLMDFLTLGNKALLVPTPGQTEQQYLADSMKSKGGFAEQQQNRLNLKTASGALDHIENSPLNETSNLLEDALDLLPGKVPVL